MESLIARIRYNKTFVVLYASIFLLAFHTFSMTYINSSFLATKIPEQSVGLVYIISAVCNIILLALMPKILRRIGNTKLITTIIGIEALAVLALSIVSVPWHVIALFIISQAILPIIIFSLDIFLETFIKDEGNTGGIRGAYWTINSIAMVLAPFVAGLVITISDLQFIYAYSAIFLLPLFFLLFLNFKKFKDPRYPRHALSESFTLFWQNRDLRSIFLVGLTLSVFYSWMTIYTPLYLFEHIGFQWNEIGALITIMLLPFLIFELPLGRIADKKLGEQELLMAGFLITALFTLLIAFIDTKDFFLWAMVLFLTRVGASTIEIMKESYFFKHIRGGDAELISFFRMHRPFGYIFGPLAATITLLFVPFNFIYIVLACLMLSGIFWAFWIHDTR